jgi:tetratricopeptide (TPR) repeat protein
MARSWRRIRYVAVLTVTILLVGLGAAYALYTVAGGGLDGDWRTVVFGGVMNEEPDSAPTPLPEMAPPADTPQLAADEPADPPVPEAAGTVVPVEEPVAAAEPQPEPAAVAAAAAAAPPAPLSEQVLERARSHAWARRFEEAEAAFDSAANLGGATAELILARARAIGWSGDYLRAAAAIRPVASATDATLELRMEEARYLWWSDQLVAADSALTAILADHPAAAEPRELRLLIREAAEPSASLARAWVADEDTPVHQLWLARALVREGQADQALAHYRAALEKPGAVPTDAIMEAVGVGLGQDSLALAASLLERYLAMRAPGADRAEVRLRLARALAWQGRFDEAVVHYDALMPGVDTPELRFERAQALAWSGHYTRARSDLDRVLRADPAHAPAFKLLGDLERWEGEPALALPHYRRAAELDPGVEGLSDGIRLARQQVEASRPDAPTAVQDITRVSPRWSITTEAFGDSESFRWIGANATRRWSVTEALALGLSVDQGWSQGPTLLGSDLHAFGLGTGASLTYALPSGLSLEARGGVRRFDDVQTFGTWGAGLRWVGLSGARLFMGYDHEPAVRHAGTFASLQAGAEMDRLSLGGGAPLGRDWSVDGQMEAQRFSTDSGDDDRFSGSLLVRRDLLPGLSLAGLVRGIASSERAPLSAEFGRLYWTPEYYVAPGVQLAYRASLAPRWGIGLRATPGYAFVREHDGGGIRRFGDNTATMETGLSITFAPRGWLFDLGADWGGAVPSGYQAAALRFQISSGGR